MLGDSLYDLRSLFEEFLISLLWRVSDVVKEELLVGVETFYQFLFVSFSPLERPFNYVMEIISFYHRQGSRLYAFQVKKTWLAIVQAVERSDKISFEEELKCHIISIVVEI